VDGAPDKHPTLVVLEGKYQLVRLLGEGGMGAVYEARHQGTGRRCAIKLISGEALAKSAEILERFRREALATGAIESQYIAHVMDTGVDPGTGSPYIVMELLVGEDLDQAVKRLGALPPDLALRIAAQACLGLQKAHEAGVVHRDIKPANLYLTRRDGGEVTTKILDFGIAKVRADPLARTEGKGLTSTGMILGSPLYMSPEQTLGSKTIGPSTDIWSLGIVLYEALSGVSPHAGAETMGALLLKICSQPVAPIQQAAPWVGPDVAAIVHRALAVDPAARWSSAKEMYAAIRALLPGGHALDEAMFVSLSEQARSTRAPSFTVPEEVRAAAPSASGGALRATAGVVAPVRGGTTAGITGSIDISRAGGVPRSAPFVAVALALLLVGGLGFGGWALWRPAASPPPAAIATAPSVPPALAPAPPPSPSLVSVPTERTARLVILPEGARVELEGADIQPQSGAVPVSGALGSTHHVRVYQGSREKRVDVVLSEEGVVPALVDLGPAPTVGGAPPKSASAPKPSPSPAPTPTATAAASAESKRPSLKMDLQ
jgi:eukaryotic-like serine/threonine-protein kinase